MACKCFCVSKGLYGCSGQLVRLSECTSNVNDKLATWHLRQIKGMLEEHELIVNRSGLPHDISPEQLNEMWICEKHRECMGRKWFPRTTCQYPAHSGPRKKLTTRNSVCSDLSKEIDRIYGKRIPIGALICVSCSQLHKLKLEENMATFPHRRAQNDYEEKDKTSRLAKTFAAMKLAEVPSTPNQTPGQSRLASTCTPGWTLECRSETDSQSSEDDEETENPSKQAISLFNASMEKLNQVSNITCQVGPLTFQLNSTWDKAKEYEKEICTDKAIEVCSLACEVIAPKAKKELFQSCFKPDTEANFSNLIPLMQAYSNAITKNVKTQILSLYAYRYPMKTLQKIHEPYAKLTEWQIRRARALARECGPGSLVETPLTHRVRLPPHKLDHFLDFANRPYFHQDVAFGTRKLRLSSGEKITMPNIIRTVTKSTMVKQYLQFCEEDKFTPLSQATLFRILDVREASQQKSLCGLDNTAADGSAGFERLSRILEELHQIGLEKSVADELSTCFRDGKTYLKTEYKGHCQERESQCPDHCRKFSLSDPIDPDFQEKCSHSHTFHCLQCDGISSSLQKIYSIVRDGESLNFYHKGQQEDLLYDIKKASDAVLARKAHILRAVNQECAKQDILGTLDESSCLIIMDWAMKFLQLRYREKQKDWYGKRGLSWHISSVISRSHTGMTEVTSYAHLFDQCTQDWYSVTSIIEDLLNTIKKKNQKIQRVYLRSDEAGCYHISSCTCIAAIKDVAERAGVAVHSYNYSEPQSGKDICDRILCPMKSSIRTYCNEGHDILSATDMRDALRQHPVKGTTAAVNAIDESKNSLSINKIQHFSNYHNFQYEDAGVRVWRCYNIGKGKLIPYTETFLRHQGPTALQTKIPFYNPPEVRVVNKESGKSAMKGPFPLFECTVAGCIEVFRKFSHLQLHLDVGKHTRTQNQYDTIKKEWALKFSSVDCVAAKRGGSDIVGLPSSMKEKNASLSLQLGWALNKPRSNIRFSQKVKDYLTARFEIGERSGHKADPTQTANDMRNARTESNKRLFDRTEWLTKSQVQSFFSRLAAVRRRGKGLMGFSEDREEDVQCLLENVNRCNVKDMVNREVNVKHPICYDIYDLCERYHRQTLGRFDVAMLKAICNYFEIPVMCRDRKNVLIDKVSEMIKDCECVCA